MDLFIGEWISSLKNENNIIHEDEKEYLNLGSYYIKKHGSSLLEKKCELKFQVDRNLSAHIYKTSNII